MRTFSTGATRDSDDTKHDFEGFLSPLALQRFAEYMTKHRRQADGNLRDSDNWQKGIPLDAYMKSMWRHFFDVWMLHRGRAVRDQQGNLVELDDALAALFFNVQGYLHEVQKAKLDAPPSPINIPPRLPATPLQSNCALSGHSFDNPRFAADVECYYCGEPNPNN